MCTMQVDQKRIDTAKADFDRATDALARMNEDASPDDLRKKLSELEKLLRWVYDCTSILVYGLANM